MTLGVKRGRKIKGGKITENMWIDRGYRQEREKWYGKREIIGVTCRRDIGCHFIYLEREHLYRSR